MNTKMNTKMNKNKSESRPFSELPKDFQDFAKMTYSNYATMSFSEDDLAWIRDEIEHRRQIELRREKHAQYLMDKKTKMAENKRTTGRPKCAFCFNAGKPSRKYLSHTDLSVCPTISKALCSKCGEIGHTRKHCKAEQDKRIRMPFKYNRRPNKDDDPDDFDMAMYNEGDSEGWPDSDDEEKECSNLVEPEIVQPILATTKEVKEVKKSWASILKPK